MTFLLVLSLLLSMEHKQGCFN